VPRVFSRRVMPRTAAATVRGRGWREEKESRGHPGLALGQCTEANLRCVERWMRGSVRGIRGSYFPTALPAGSSAWSREPIGTRPRTGRG
jgi:hypothetical protein